MVYPDAVFVVVYDVSSTRFITLYIILHVKPLGDGAGVCLLGGYIGLFGSVTVFIYWFVTVIDDLDAFVSMIFLLLFNLFFDYGTQGFFVTFLF